MPRCATAVAVSQSVSDWRFACLQKAKLPSGGERQFFLLVPEINSGSRLKIEFVRGPSHGTEIAASSCETARDLLSLCLRFAIFYFIVDSA